MNTGIQDALNLGWKLGAAVRRNVQAQSLLMDQQGTRDPDLTVAKDLFAALMRLRAVRYHLDDMSSVMGIRYPMPGAEEQPFVGLPAPDRDLGPVRSHELLRRGRSVLIDPADMFAKAAAFWQDRVDRTGQGADAEPMLIRPDGYVCWAGNPDDLEPAPGRWFGEPH